MGFLVRSNTREFDLLDNLSWVMLLFNLCEDFLGNKSLLNRGVMFTLHGILRECLFQVRALFNEFRCLDFV